ncbi:MAG: hypothetical protein KC462_00220, partial [Cyanobacteria bacterium HKST-UBA05]|nr:hypothetical protein [Cyanobacteria bacterium HKST-UBA05]
VDWPVVAPSAGLASYSVSYSTPYSASYGTRPLPYRPAMPGLPIMPPHQVQSLHQPLSYGALSADIAAKPQTALSINTNPIHLEAFPSYIPYYPFIQVDSPAPTQQEQAGSKQQRQPLSKNPTPPKAMSPLVRQAVRNLDIPETVRPAAVKKQQVSAMALKLFAGVKGNKTALLKHLSEMGIEVHHGQVEPWVDDALNHLGGHDAVFCAPVSPFFPGRSTGSPTGNAIPPYGRFEQNLDREGKLAILVKSTANHMDVLFHEAYHALQCVAGLPFESRNFESVVASEPFITNFYRNTRHYSYLAKVNYLERPWLWLKRKLGLINPKPDGPGASIRTKMNREIEAINFLIGHKDSLGLSGRDVQTDKYRLHIYKALRDLSYKLD